MSSPNVRSLLETFLHERLGDLVRLFCKLVAHRREVTEKAVLLLLPLLLLLPNV